MIRRLKIRYIIIFSIAIIWILFILIKKNDKNMLYLSEIKYDGSFDMLYSSINSRNLAVVENNEIHFLNKFGTEKLIKVDFDIKYLDYDSEKALIISDSNILYLYDLRKNILSDKIMDNVKICRVWGESYAAVDENGDLFVWGDNSHHIFSTSVPEIIEEPKKIETISDVADIRFNSKYSILLTENGNVYESGENNDNSFSRIKELQDVRSINIGSGSLAVRSDGSAVYWLNSYYSGWQSPYIANTSDITQICNDNRLSNYSPGTVYWICSDKNKNLWCWGEDVLTKNNSKAIKFFNEPTCLKGISEIDNVYPCGANVFVTKQDKIYIVKAHN